MRWFTKQLKDQSGFTLVEVLISMLILSIVIASASVAFVYSARISQENKLSMAAINLANERVEEIRSKEFSEVGTKIKIAEGSFIDGDPAGNFLQEELKEVDGISFRIKTDITWEEEGAWDTLGNVEWDYKSVKVTVFPINREGDTNLTKVIETYVTRDSAQPGIIGGNIRIRLLRGWNSETKTPVSNAKVMLKQGTNVRRQIQTNNNGAARFINITPGNYFIDVNPTNIGMILLPGSEDWPVYFSDYSNIEHNFYAEYPCQLRLKLKDYNGNPIVGMNGRIYINTPFGSSINKSFAASQLDSLGQLPNDLITDLWPVGTGYIGLYEITNVQLPGYIYFGSYEGSGTSEILWNGSFDGPGTYKNITSYFYNYPITPEGISTAWVSDDEIVTTYTNYALDEHGNIVNGKFSSADPTERLDLSRDKTVHFNASSIYFENIGTNSTAGLYIGNRSKLYLHAGQVIFRGTVQFENSSRSYNIGKIILKTIYQDNTSAPTINGSLIGGNPAKEYGKIYLTKPMILGSSTIIEPGGYYYYDGLELPNQKPELITITADNFIE